MRRFFDRGISHNPSSKISYKLSRLIVLIFWSPADMVYQHSRLDLLCSSTFPSIPWTFWRATHYMRFLQGNLTCISQSLLLWILSRRFVVWADISKLKNWKHIFHVSSKCVIYSILKNNTTDRCFCFRVFGDVWKISCLAVQSFHFQNMIHYGIMREYKWFISCFFAML